MHYRHAEETVYPHTRSAKVLHDTAYLQITLQRELERLDCMTRMDDTITWETDFDNLLCPLDATVGRLGCARLRVAAHESMLYGTSIS